MAIKVFYGDTESPEYEESFKRFQGFLRNGLLPRVLDRNRTFLLDEGKRIQSVTINDKMSSYTDGNRVVVSGMPFMMRPDYGEIEWTADLQTALAHEIQHDNSSDFEEIKEFQNWYAEFMEKKYKLHRAATMKIAHSVLNCTEDGRINEIVVQRFPGYLKKMRWDYLQMRNSMALVSPGESPGEELRDFTNEICTYTKTGLHQLGYEVYAGTRFEAEVEKILPWLDAAVAAPTAHDCVEETRKVMELCADYVAELVQTESDIMKFLEQLFQDHDYSQSGDSREEQTGNPNSGSGANGGITVRIRVKKKSSDQKSGSSSGDSESDEKDKDPGEGASRSGSDGKDEDTDGDASGSGSDGKDKDTDGDASGSGSDGKGEGSDSGGKSSKKSSGSDSEEKGESSGKDGKDSNSTGKSKSPDSIDRPLTNDDVGPGGELGDGDRNDLSAEDAKEIARQVMDEYRRAQEIEKATHVDHGRNSQLSRGEKKSMANRYGDTSFVEELWPPQKLPVPATITEPAKTLHNELKKILQVRRAESANRKKGTINPTALWKVGTKNTDIFKKRTPPKLSDSVVFELIDGSGSMAGTIGEWSSNSPKKLSAALTTAAIMEEALKGLAATKIAVFSAGYSSVKHKVLKDYDQQPVGNRCYDALATCRADGCNKDGYSIRIALYDLIKRPERNKILIVLSDGLPSQYSGDNEGIADVASAVKEARNAGIKVVPIMYGSKSECEGNLKDYVAMYGDERNLTTCNTTNILGAFTKILTRMLR